MEMEFYIRPSRKLSFGNLPEIWHSRDLLSLLVWRDFVAKYKQTILGPIWFILQPLLPTVVFTVVFGRVAGMSTDGLPQFLFFLCNQIVWGYFAANYSSTANSLFGNQHLFSKVYIPRLVPAVASIISNGFSLAVQCGLFVVFYLYFKFATPAGVYLSPSWYILFVPLLIVLAALQGLGFGLWMAVVTAKYRDLQQISAVLVQMWMYGSAVVFPLSQIPSKYQALVSLNPVTFLTEAFRYCVLGQGTISSATGGYAVLISLIVLAGGLLLYDRSARKFIDIA